MAHIIALQSTKKSMHHTWQDELTKHSYSKIETSIKRERPIYSTTYLCTNMITHGHSEERYGHFALGLWVVDPNITFTSLSLCFKNLEWLDRHQNGDLDLDGMPRSSSTLLKAQNSRKALAHHWGDIQNALCMDGSSQQYGQHHLRPQLENLLL